MGFRSRVLNLDILWINEPFRTDQGTLGCDDSPATTLQTMVATLVSKWCEFGGRYHPPHFPRNKTANRFVRTGFRPSTVIPLGEVGVGFGETQKNGLVSPYRQACLEAQKSHRNSWQCFQARKPLSCDPFGFR